MEKKLFFNNNHGLRLAGILLYPGSEGIIPLVAICHGFSTSKDGIFFRMLSEQLLNIGIATFRFDFTGHGESEGELGDITISGGVDDLKSAVEFLASNYPWVDLSNIGLYGRSFGGNVALWYAAKYHPVKVIVLNAPLSDYVAFQKNRYREDEILNWSKNGFIMENAKGKEIKINYHAYEDAISNNTYELSKRIQAKTLIVHGDADEVIPLKQSIKLAEYIGEKAVLEVIPFANHNFEISNPAKNPLALSIEFFQRTFYG